LLLRIDYRRYLNLEKAYRRGAEEPRLAEKR